MSPHRFTPSAPAVQAVVRLDEALPPEPPVPVFGDVIQGIRLAHFAVAPGPQGAPPAQPHALVGVRAGGSRPGVRAARTRARLVRRAATVASRAGGSQPNYRTLARGRRATAAAFTAVF